MTKPPTPADTETREEAKDARGKRASFASETTGIVVGVDDGGAPVLPPPERRLLLRYADQEGDRYDYPHSPRTSGCSSTSVQTTTGTNIVGETAVGERGEIR
jgi:hypothetical protein